MDFAHPVFGPNKLKLGVFCMNTSSALTLAKDVFKPSWNECVTLARMADDAGFEAFVPIARWKGYVDGDFGHPSNHILEPFTFAAGIAQATRRIGVFATTHASMTHPLQIAKQASTIDMISGGRFAMNVVGGWNRREFEMFGIDLLGHEERYSYLADWLGIIRQLWSATEELDIKSAYFELKGAVSRPQPIHGRVPIMNAGFSPTGMRFAAANSDVALIGLLGNSEQQWADQIGSYKALARDEFGKEIQVWTNAAAILRGTDEEGEALRRYYCEDMADLAAIDGFVSTIARENKKSEDSDEIRFLRRSAVLGTGFPMIGSPETVSERLISLSRAGVDGVIMNFVDYIDGLHRFNRDVLPLLEQAGLREKPHQ